MIVRGLAVLLLWLSVSLAAYAKTQVPAPLQPWISWVLETEQYIDCTPHFQSPKQKICFWIGQVKLNLDPGFLQFRFDVDAKIDGWMPLPGTDKLWPQELKIGGNRAPVVSRNGFPFVWVKRGKQTVLGVIRWQEFPQNIPLPPSYGMLDLRIDKALEGKAYIGAENRLWLVRENVRQGLETDGLQLKVFRKLTDSEPRQLETLLRLEVSGTDREATLGKLQLTGWELLDFDAPLPARIEDDGAMRIQLRPGKWVLHAKFRQLNQNELFLPEPQIELGWPEQEVWVVESRLPLRSAEIEGEAIDPQQTLLPEKWKSLPAYKLSRDAGLKLKALPGSNSAQAVNRIEQNTTAWLAFDAQRWVWRDHLSGRIEQGWRMEQKAPFVLGHAKINQQPQLITQLTGNGQRGVEARYQQLDMEAVSTLPLEKSGWKLRIPASSWADNGHLDRVNTQLNLPPGWWPLAVLGTDSSQGSWLDRWTLWDVFLGLLIVAAFWRLEGWMLGLASFFGLAFGYHESGAPVWIWLAILLPLALLRVVDRNPWKKWLTVWRWAAFVTIAGVMLSYAIDQLRMTVYPQLEQPYVSQGDMFAEDLEMSAPMSRVVDAMSSAESRDTQSSKSRPVGGGSWQALNAPLPTGPGIPRWQWKSVQLTWTGGVSAEQAADLLLLTPMQARFARAIHLGLLAVMLVALVGRRHPPQPSEPSSIAADDVRAGAAKLAAISMLAIMATGLCLSGESRAEGFPSDEMLSELRGRLTEGPDCIPTCADLNSAEVVLDGYSLTISMEMSVLAKVAVPIPAKVGYWVPQHVFVDGREVKFATVLPAGGVAVEAAAAGSNGVWSIEFEPGIHEVVLEGSVRERDQFKLLFPLPAKRFNAKIDDWVMSGASLTELHGSELNFERTSISIRNEESRQTLFQEAAPAFVRIEREIELDINWHIRTRVIRMAPKRGAITLSVPLLAGERILSGDAVNEDGLATFTLSDMAQQLEWESNLGPVKRIDLTAPINAPWVEHWAVRISPHWRLQYTGVSPYELVSEGQWFPRWQPRPGDSVVLQISQPLVLDGQMLTVDAVDMHQEVGSRSQQMSMMLQLRSAKSQRYSFPLPPNSTLQSIQLNGDMQPFRQDDGLVDVVVGYGQQSLNVVWTTPLEESNWQLMTPSIQLPGAAANISMTTSLPTSVWPIWVQGPAHGPAILFWGVLGVTLVVALALGGHEGNPLGRGSWCLLALGATLGWVQGLIILVVWFYSLQYRSQIIGSAGKWARRGYQVWLVLLTIMAVGWILASIPQGLVGQPMDYVAGNGSSMWWLRWFEDSANGALPATRVVIVPVMAYRIAVLLWSLWLAFAMLRWLQWGWLKFSESLENGRPLAGLDSVVPETGEGSQGATAESIWAPKTGSGDEDADVEVPEKALLPPEEQLSEHEESLVETPPIEPPEAQTEEDQSEGDVDGIGDDDEPKPPHGPDGSR